MDERILGIGAAMDLPELDSQSTLLVTTVRGFVASGGDRELFFELLLLGEGGVVAVARNQLVVGA